MHSVYDLVDLRKWVWGSMFGNQVGDNPPPDFREKVGSWKQIWKKLEVGRVVFQEKVISFQLLEKLEVDSKMYEKLAVGSHLPSNFSTYLEEILTVGRRFGSW